MFPHVTATLRDVLRANAWTGRPGWADRQTHEHPCWTRTVEGRRIVRRALDRLEHQRLRGAKWCSTCRPARDAGGEIVSRRGDEPVLPEGAPTGCDQRGLAALKLQRTAVAAQRPFNGLRLTESPFAGEALTVTS